MGAPDGSLPKGIADRLMGGYSQFDQTGSPEERARIENDVFSRLTKNLNRDMDRELKTKEQQLYNQGIPYSDDPESRYQKEIRGIQDRYDQVKLDAGQRATEVGGQELQRSFGMGLASHQQGQSDVSQYYGMGESSQAKQFAQDLATHQQGQSDISFLQNQGTGLMYQPGPGFQGVGVDIAAPSTLNYQNQALKLQKKQVNNQAKQFAQSLAARGSGSGAPVDTSGL